ncbi:hypothetical protein LCL95_16540 [Bacillus timonensis]|nr:hypothetical protein [Bacillus timonensis]
MEDFITLKDFLRVLKKRKKILMITTLSIWMVSFLSAAIIFQPTYKISRNIVVGNLQEDSSSNVYQEQQMISNIIASYIDIIKSPIVLKSVKNNLNLKQPLSVLENQITIINKEDSRIVTIEVRANDPKVAQEIADAIAVNSQEKMQGLLNITKIQVLFEDSMDETAEKSSNLGIFMLLGLGIGVFSALGLALLMHHLDPTVYSELVINKLDIPILGYIENTEYPSIEFRRE